MITGPHREWPRGPHPDGSGACNVLHGPPHAVLAERGRPGRAHVRVRGVTVLTMDLHDLDVALAGLRGAADAVGSNLLELEADSPGLTLFSATFG